MDSLALVAYVSPYRRNVCNSSLHLLIAFRDSVLAFLAPVAVHWSYGTRRFWGPGSAFLMSSLSVSSLVSVGTVDMSFVTVNWDSDNI